GHGALWVALAHYPAGRTLIRVEPATGRITTSRYVRDYVDAIAVGKSGVWTVTNNGTESRGVLNRFDARSGERIAPLSGGEDPTVIALGAGGVWVLHHRPRTVTRVDPRTNRISATIPVGPNPGGLAAGERAVWVTHGGSMSRIDPQTNRIVQT